jgi:hypothetical protein
MRGWGEGVAVGVGDEVLGGGGAEWKVKVGVGDGVIRGMGDEVIRG